MIYGVNNLNILVPSFSLCFLSNDVFIYNIGLNENYFLLLCPVAYHPFKTRCTATIKIKRNRAFRSIKYIFINSVWFSQRTATSSQYSIQPSLSTLVFSAVRALSLYMKYRCRPGSTRSNPCEICGGLRGTWTDFSPSTWDLHISIIPSGLHNRLHL